MIQQADTYRKKSAAKGTIALRIVIAFTLAAVFIPVYIAAILKVIEMLRG